jgi:hypothetical protein
MASPRLRMGALVALLVATTTVGLGATVGLADTSTLAASSTLAPAAGPSTTTPRLLAAIATDKDSTRWPVTSRGSPKLPVTISEGTKWPVTTSPQTGSSVSVSVSLQTTTATKAAGTLAAQKLMPHRGPKEQPGEESGAGGALSSRGGGATTGTAGALARSQTAEKAVTSDDR